MVKELLQPGNDTEMQASDTGCIRFGINIGLAFQLQDDLLVCLRRSRPAFGKNIGGDILCNKKDIQCYIMGFTTLLQILKKRKLNSW